MSTACCLSLNLLTHGGWLAGRYLAICHGLRCRVTGSMARVIIALIWSFAVAVMSPWASLSHRASTAVYDHVTLGQFITVSIYRCLHTFMSPWAVFYQQREHLTAPTANTSTGNTSDVTSGVTPPAFCSSNASGQNELKAPLTSFPVAARSLVCHIRRSRRRRSRVT